MKREGYTVTSYDMSEVVDGLAGGFMATKTDEGEVEQLVALLFDSKKDAKDYYNDLSDKSNVIQEGKWVYWGTEDAVEDFED